MSKPRLLTTDEIAARYKKATDADECARLFAIGPYAEEIECLRSQIHMTVARLGGIVEGNPTGAHNFLQRIDELREMERQSKPQYSQASELDADEWDAEFRAASRDGGK